MKKIWLSILFFEFGTLFTYLLLFSLELPLIVYEWMLVIAFILACVLSTKEKFFNIFQIFLGTFFIFNLSRIFLKLINDSNYRELDLFYSGVLSYTDSIELLKVYTVFIFGITIAWTLNYIFLKQHEQTFVALKLISIKNFITYGLVVYYVLFFIKMLITIKLTQQFGYLYIFTGGISNYNFPFFLTGVENITRFLFILYLFLNKSKVNKFIIMGYLFVLLFGMLSGQRGPGLVTLLLIAWIYSERYKKINLRKVLYISLFSILATRFIAVFRYDNKESITENIIFKFLNSQGISMNILAELITFKDKLVYNGNVYFFHYFKILFNPNQGGQTIERLNNTTYLGDQLTYFLSPEIYLAGRGTGTSLVAEFYDLTQTNMFLFFTVSLLFMFGSLWLAKNFQRNIFLFIIGFNYFYSFIYSPRDSIGKSLNYIKNDFLLLICVVLIASILYKSRDVFVTHTYKRRGINA
ncbi:O-antigen polysaccharide polymerase Wzy [Bacillus sp. JJ1533]|uniref:O-antigen polysaccharide polymerase Wzy n=1 Tax=Bacillus sp. JJ1533 TaxID=3122959 RepID=UPI002FFF83C9